MIPLHHHRVVAVREGEPPVCGVEGEHPAIVAFAGEDEPREPEHVEQDGGDLRSRDSLEPFERVDRLEDDGIGGPHPPFTPLDAGKQCVGLGRLVR